MIRKKLSPYMKYEALGKFIIVSLYLLQCGDHMKIYN